MMYVWKVHYQVATYEGDLTVSSFSDLEDEQVKAKARAQLKRKAGGSLPFGYENFTIISKETT